MKIFLIAALSLTLGTTSLSAQINFAAIQNQHSHSLASSQLPSLLGDDVKHAELFFLAPHFGFGNNMITANDLTQLSKEGKLSNQYIDDLLQKMPKQGNIWLGMDVPVLNLFFNVRRKKEPFLSMGLGIREKMDANFSLNKDFFSLLYKGNKQFENRSVNLSPSLNMMLYNEYFFAIAGQFTTRNLIPSMKNNIVIKPAVRVRYLNGIMGIDMPTSKINMYTAPEGRYIDFTTDMTLNMASAIDTLDIGENTNSELGLGNFKAAGSGLGVDIGIGLELLENLRLNLGVVDVGGINFNRNVINYTKKDKYRYEGVTLNEDGEMMELADFETLLQPNKTYHSFKQSLPTRFLIHANYGLIKKERRKVSYFAHNFSVAYVQGFKNYLSSTRAPALHLGYAYNLANYVNAGINVTAGGVNKFQAGAMLGIRVLVFKLGIASNNLLPLFYSKAGSGTDASFYFGLYF